jgi:cysteine desulfurase/selenocysteine lyase
MQHEKWLWALRVHRNCSYRRQKAIISIEILCVLVEVKLLMPAPFNLDAVRADFPILQTEVNGQPLTYLDNAATAQKPQSVIDTLEQYYRKQNANIHRGLHHLSEQATEAYEQVRHKVADFIQAPDPDEVIFVRGATEAINLIAHGWTQSGLKAGDEILITHMEHHANIVPWQIAAERTGAALKVIPVDDRGVLDLDAFDALLGASTRLLALTHVSNSLGTINPVKQLIEKAHAKNIPVLLDGAQSVPHMPIDVQALGCDFFVFSGHKLFGPTGIGVLWGKRAYLEPMPYYQSGGDMIEQVDFEGTTYKPIPSKFEAGTPHIAGVIGLGAAIDYLNGLDRVGALQHETDLLNYATEQLGSIEGLRIWGQAPDKASVLSFTIDGIHPHDMSTFLNADGIAIRAGHHCTQPLLKRFGLPATARASFSFYNTLAEVDRLRAGILKLKQFFL